MGRIMDAGGGTGRLYTAPHECRLGSGMEISMETRPLRVRWELGQPEKG